MFVELNFLPPPLSLSLSHTHTHTHKYVNWLGYVVSGKCLFSVAGAVSPHRKYLHVFLYIKKILGDKFQN